MGVRAGIVVGVMGVLAAACSNDDVEVLQPVVLGMTETSPPLFDDGETQIFQVTREVQLPFRNPREGERASGQQDPYPRRPFHVASDSRITVRFTLTNLDDAKHNVDVLVDPWNEFVRYVPGVTMGNEDEVIPNFSGIQRPFVLEPKARIEGILTPDDMVELATDLTTAMALDRRPPDAEGDLGGAVLFNRAFNVQNRSSEPDPVLRTWIPPGDKSTVAAIIGFDLGLRTLEPARIAIELVIDVDDKNGDRIIQSDEDPEPGTRAVGRPGATLSPPAEAPGE